MMKRGKICRGKNPAVKEHLLLHAITCRARKPLEKEGTL